MCLTWIVTVNRQCHFFKNMISPTFEIVNRHQNLLCIMFATGDKKGHAKKCLILVFKVIH